MGAGAQAVLPVERPQADERRTRGIGERGPRGHEAANEVLLGREQLAEAEIVRRGLAVQLAAGGMPFLDAQDAERLGAVRRDAEGSARFQDGAHQTVAEARRYADLVSQLAGEGEAVDPRRRAAAHGNLAAGKIGKGGVSEVVGRIDHALQHIARAGPRDRELRPLLGDRDHFDIELGPQTLLAEFEMLHHLDRVGGGGGHEITIVGEPRRGAVIEHKAILAQHQPVARLAHRQGREGVGIDAIEEGARVTPLHVDLAERGDVAHPDLASHRRHLAVHRILRLLSGPRIIERAKPRPGLDEDGTLLLGPTMRSRKTRGTEILPAVMAGKGADGHGGEGRAEGRAADRADIASGDGSEHRRAIRVGDLALVGRHAERGVALEMLRRAEALARGELHVRHRHVVLEIDESLAAAVGNLPHGTCRTAFVRGSGSARRRGSEAALGSGRRTGGLALGQA